MRRGDSLTDDRAHRNAGDDEVRGSEPNLPLGPPANTGDAPFAERVRGTDGNGRRGPADVTPAGGPS